MTVRTAIILAAGRGTRLSSLHPDLPKALLEVGGETLLSRSLGLLRDAGIERCVVVTGHHGKTIEDLAPLHAGLEVIENPDYAITGSMASLACALTHVRDDFLLLESDLYYEARALHALLDLHTRDAILCSGETRASDEVYVEARLGRLTGMSKRASDLSHLTGELVGISRISRETAQAMLEAFHDFSVAQGHRRMDYETGALMQVARQRAVSVLLIPDLLWGEIDDPLQLARVRGLLPEMAGLRERPLRVRREILLNPGPATTSDEVKRALLIPDVCPREEDFCALAQRTRARLSALAGNAEEVATVLVVGSGTAALEAMLTSLIEPSERLLVLDNGDYGARLAQIATTHALDHDVLRDKFASSFDLLRLERELASGRFSHLTFVHHETSSGMLNPLDDIVRLARRYDVKVLVDAMSSFGATPIHVGEAGVEALTASANKCLHGMAGLSFVIATKRALARPATPRVLSTDLCLEYAHVQKTGQSRFTLPPQLVSALSVALDALEKETLKGRSLRYAERMQLLLLGLAELGFLPILPRSDQSDVLVCVRPPAHLKFEFELVHDALRKRGFTIYPGKASAPDCFRLSVLGDLSLYDVARFLKELRSLVGK